MWDKIKGNTISCFYIEFVCNNQSRRAAFNDELVLGIISYIRYKDIKHIEDDI